LLFTTGSARSKKFNDKPSKGKTPPPCAFVLCACLFTTSGSVVYWSSHTTSKELLMPIQSQHKNIDYLSARLEATALVLE
ncbi:hypothetical protein FQ014_25895, partial [Escherichia coli]|nr:hypothetical protein [Escherichia coli]